jgi:hypothetical protein
MKKQILLVGLLATSLTGLTATAAVAQHQTPKDQPAQTIDASAPAGDLLLGTVRLPKAVTADGKPLPAGTYQVRLTGQEAGPPAVGVTENLERWVEFVQGKVVKGREVVSIVPATEAKLVAKDAPPPANGVKVQTLRGNDYVRVWFNKAGNYYLVHLPTGAAGN